MIRSRPVETGFEILAEVAAGKHRGRSIRFVAVGDAQAETAVALSPGDELVIWLRWRPRQGGGSEPVVANFNARSQPTVLTVLGGIPTGDGGGEPNIWPLFYDNDPTQVEENQEWLRSVPIDQPLKPAVLFPEELGEQLRGDLSRGEEPEEPRLPEAWNSAALIHRILDRIASDHPLCVLQESGGRQSVTPFEPVFERFCRAEHLRSGGQQVTASVYQYGRDLDLQARSRGGADHGFHSPVWSRWIHTGFSGEEDPTANLMACRRFVTALVRLGVPRNRVLVFSLGDGRLEVMSPTAAFACTARPGFEYVAGYISQVIADWSMLCSPASEGAVAQARWRPQETQPIDAGLHVPLAAVAMPNTPLATTGCFKVRVSLRELAEFDAPRIGALAASPRPFNPPPWRTAPCETLRLISEYAVAVAVSRSQALDQLTQANGWVYRRTFEFMFVGAAASEAESRLFGAAMNLLDLACPVRLLEALLAPAAGLSGLPAAKVKRAIANAVLASRKARPLPIEPMPMFIRDEED